MTGAPILLQDQTVPLDPLDIEDFLDPLDIEDFLDPLELSRIFWSFPELLLRLGVLAWHH